MSFALSAGSAWLTLVYARRAGLIDVPNHRSSHTVPTPRGGGLAIVAAVVAAVTYRITHIADGAGAVFAVLGAALAALTLVGWLDDRGRMAVGVRISVHIGCGCAVTLLVNAIAPVPGWVNVLWLAWWIFWTAASINIVNFMDGVDGIVAAQGVVYGIFLFALLPEGVAGSRYGLVLAAACFGFLFWNWAPAKIFMGDVGSGPLGMFFVIGGALALQHSRAALVFLPLYPLFLDALITIVRRYQRGERLMDAHRQHLYQRIANGNIGHAPVTSVYALAATIGAFVAILVKDSTMPRVTEGVVIYVVAIGVIWKVADARWKSAQIAKGGNEVSPTV